jgi:hypothetical protein
MRLTCVANFKLVSVSPRCASRGLAITNMSVFELPPREYCSRYVNYMELAVPNHCTIFIHTFELR